MKTKRKWIILDYNTPDALRAEDIPYDSTQSVKDAIQRGTGGGLQGVTGIIGDEGPKGDPGVTGLQGIGLGAGATGIAGAPAGYVTVTISGVPYQLLYR